MGEESGAKLPVNQFVLLYLEKIEPGVTVGYHSSFPRNKVTVTGRKTFRTGPFGQKFSEFSISLDFSFPFVPKVPN